MCWLHQTRMIQGRYPLLTRCGLTVYYAMLLLMVVGAVHVPCLQWDVKLSSAHGMCSEHNDQKPAASACAPYRCHCCTTILQVRAAQGAGVPIVHPDWLLACKFSWARQPEEQYALPQYTGAGVGGFSSSKFLGPPPKAAAVAQERQAVLKTAGRTG